jgi:hypothetical protein
VKPMIVIPRKTIDTHLALIGLLEEKVDIYS